MSQNSIVIPNTGTLTGLALVNDINAALDSLQSNYSGNSDPGAIGAYRFWADSLNGLLKMRNAANSGWVVLGPMADFGIQSSAQIRSSAGGTVDALTGSFTPAITSLPSGGLRLQVRAAGANATTTPTFTPNSGVVTAYTIVKGSNQALAPGDIAGPSHWLDLDWDATLSKWVLLNPATGVAANVVDATTSTKGKVQLADSSSTIALTDATKVVTPSGLSSLLNVVPGAGNAPIFSIRAWINFNCINSSGATYTQSGTLITINQTAHGGLVGQWVYISFTSGTGVSGYYQIQTSSTNSYTLTGGSSLSTSGNCTRRALVYASGNISNLTYNGTGDFTATFSVNIDDSFYGVSGSGCDSQPGGSNAAFVSVASSNGAPTLKTASNLRFTIVNTSNTNEQVGSATLIIIR